MARILRSSPAAPKTNIFNLYIQPTGGGTAFDAASSSGYKASLSSYSWSHTCTGSNRGLLVNISVFATGTVSSITYNSIAMRFIRADVSGVYRNEIWALENPSSGSNSIAVTLSTSLTSIGSAGSYTNVNQTDMIESHFGANGIGGTPSVSITTVDDNSWVVDGLTTANTTMSVGGSQTQRANNSGALGTGAIGDQGPITPVGSVTTSWSAVGGLDSWALGIVVLDTVSGTAYAMIHTASLSFSGSFNKLTSRLLSATLSFVGVFSKLINKVLSATLSFSGAISRFISHSLSAALNFVGNLNRLTAKTSFTANLPTSGAFSKTAGKTLTASLSFSGSFSKRINKVLTASLGFSGTIVRAIARNLTAALTFAGNFTGKKSGTVGTKSPFFILLTDGRTAIRLGNNLYMPL